MRKFDHDGLLLAEFQGKLFERSSEFGFSTGIFIRRFLHSDLLKILDMNDPANLSLDVNEAMNNFLEQFGDSDYGKIKYPSNMLFWMGYLYRYISYTRNVSTGYVMKLFSYKQLNDVFYAFHTQDPEWCVQNLLILNDLTEDIFDCNFRLKKVISQSSVH